MFPHVLHCAVMVISIPVISSASSTVAPSSTTTVSLVTSSSICRLNAVNKEVRAILNAYLKNIDINVVRYTVTFKDYPDTVLADAGGTLFRPNVWIRTVNQQGVRLLMLNDNFEFYSMGFLSNGIAEMKLELVDSPTGCLQHLNSEQRVDAMRNLLVSDFYNENPEFSLRRTHQRVCTMVVNKTIENGNAEANITYICCRFKSDQTEMVCEYIESDMWINLLHTIILVATLLAVLFFPQLVPRFFYIHHYITYKNYKAHILQNRPVKLLKTLKEWSMNLDDKAIPLKELDIKNCKVPLEETTWMINDVTVQVASSDYLRENEAPVTWTKLINETFIEVPNTRRCWLDFCMNTLHLSLYFSEKICIFFYYIRKMRKRLVWVICFVPLVVSISCSLTYLDMKYTEYVIALARQNITAQQGIYSTSVRIRRCLNTLLASLIPLVILVVLRMKNVKLPSLGKVLCACERDSVLSAFQSSMQMCLVIVRTTGFLGLILSPVIVIVTLPLSMVLHLPLFSVVIRLFILPGMHISRLRGLLVKINTLINPEATNEPPEYLKTNCCNMLLYNLSYSVLFCLVLYWTHFCLSFYIKVVFYTFLGLVFHSDKMLIYCAMALFCAMYARDIFKCLTMLYVQYARIMRKLIFAQIESELAKCTLPEKKQLVLSPLSPNNECSIDINYDHRTKRVSCDSVGMAAIFLRKSHDRICYAISKNFVMSNVNLRVPGCPGVVRSNVMRSFNRLFSTSVFLGLFLFVVLVFGDRYKISSLKQLLLTASGGLLPLIFGGVARSSLGTCGLKLENTYFSDLRLMFKLGIESSKEKLQVVEVSLSPKDAEAVVASLSSEDSTTPEVRACFFHKRDYKSTSRECACVRSPIEKGKDVKEPETVVDLEPRKEKIKAGEEDSE
ncbi:uncharacterized protein [Haliotis asinina]|uniref:uncharacterized protein n=1 Tax=Haliotis asinina TaxID=109174 RepID=UPI0035325776